MELSEKVKEQQSQKEKHELRSHYHETILDLHQIDIVIEAVNERGDWISLKLLVHTEPADLRRNEEPNLRKRSHTESEESDHNPDGEHP